MRGFAASWLFGLALPCALAPPSAFAQDALTPLPPASQTTNALAQPDPQSTNPLGPTSLDEKWDYFLKESVDPLAFVSAGVQGTLSQLTRSAPLYGKHFWHRDAFVKRISANLADDTSENFFADFVMASALHEDTRYRKEGRSHSVEHRIGYAISRSILTRTDAGDPTFNWANVVGCGMSAGLSNAYYPPLSRTPSVTLVNWGTNIAGAGLSNLAPEFGSDLGHWFKRRLGFRH